MKKTFDYYLNDPDLANEPQSLREVHAARLMIQDETKGMTAEERTAYYHKGAKAAFEQMGFTPEYMEPDPSRL